MSKSEASNTILQLRALREQLCGKQSQWKEAFQVRDAVVEKITAIHSYCGSENAELHIVHQQITCLLEYLEVTPNENLEDE